MKTTPLPLNELINYLDKTPDKNLVIVLTFTVREYARRHGWAAFEDAVDQFQTAHLFDMLTGNVKERK